MKFRLVDRVFQRTLVSPSSLQEVQEQPSTEQAPSQAAQVSSVEQFQTESSHVPIDAPHVPATVQASSPVHIQEDLTLVSLPKT